LKGILSGRKGRLIILSIFLLIAVLSSKLQSFDKIKVVSTIFPLTELTSRVAGSRAEVRQIIPSSADIHHFQLRPSDLKAFSQAQLLVAVGENLEPWLARLEKSVIPISARKIKFFDLIKSCQYPGLIAEDPHLWLDLEADILLVQKIAEELIILDPAGKDFYLENASRLVSELKTLDENFRNSLSRCRNRFLVVAGHQAFGYLAARYGLEQVSLTGANPEAQPAPRQIQTMVELIKSRKIKAVFYESSSSPAYAQTIARETGATLYRLSAGVNLTSAELRQKIDFLSLMKNNLQTLIQALECE